MAWMGGLDLDLTDAALPPDRVEMELVAVMGVVTVLVPRDVRVGLDGGAVTWTFEGGDGTASAPPPRGTVRISGRTTLGKIHLRLVGPRSEAFARQGAQARRDAG
jgi:hypothetical protein